LKAPAFFWQTWRARRKPCADRVYGHFELREGQNELGRSEADKDLDVTIEGYDVIVVEDIVDSGSH